MSKKNKIEKPRKSLKREILEFMITFDIGALLFLIAMFFFQVAQVDGDSMYPTYQDKNYVLGYKQFQTIEANDVIAFEIYNEMTGTDEFHIKRVVGVPNDKIEIKEDQLFVNGKLAIDNMGGFEPLEPIVTLGADEYYVIGDNYEVSNDSRSHGPVKEEDIFVNILFSKDNPADNLHDADDIKKIEEKEKNNENSL